jgi:hypothetical protein
MSNLKNHRISKLKNPTAGKSTSVLSELNYGKAAFLKEPRKKHGRLIWLLAF